MLRGMIRAESLLNHTLDLCDIADFNDALDCSDENAARAQAAAQAARR